jgi:hypothetical protein
MTNADPPMQTTLLANPSSEFFGDSALIDLPGEVIAALNARDIMAAIGALQEAEGLEFDDAQLVIERHIR